MKLSDSLLTNFIFFALTVVQFYHSVIKVYRSVRVQRMNRLENDALQTQHVVITHF